MFGVGILKGLGVTLKHFLATYADDLKYAGRKYLRQGNFEERQGINGAGAYTVMYPEEKLAVPERFRFVPFLVMDDADHPERPEHIWCTSCGICAKVCPPQCIWIVRGEDPVTKRPVPEPQAFFIDIDICMNCGYCAEFCPFDAIKMDHDYELSDYDRTSTHIHDMEKLRKPLSYWKSIAPTTATEEAEARGGWEHPDVIKEREKAAKAAAKATAPAPAAPSVQATPAAATPQSPEKAAEVSAVAAMGTGGTPTAVAEAPGEAPVAVAEAAPTGEISAEERKRKREEALARKRAKQESEGG